MTEEFDIQCDSCGTIYSTLEDVCPYCGQPQPLFDEPDSEPPAESVYDDQAEPHYTAYPSPVSAYPDTTAEFLDDEYVRYEDGYARPEGYPEYVTYDEGNEEQTAFYDRYEEFEAREGFRGYAEGEPFDDYDHDPAEFQPEAELEAQPRRFTKRRAFLGCLGVFLCMGLVYGGIGVLAAYHGLLEQASAKQVEAETHFQRGQDHLANNSLELAIAELELALSLNPGLIQAREALREARRLLQAQPTPTSETRSAAAASIMQQAEDEVTEKKWLEAAETLAKIRDLDPNYQPERVSELFYTAHYQLGLKLLTPDNIEKALLAFEQALTERPNDPEGKVEYAKASLYIEGQAAEATDRQEAVAAFRQLYREDENYLDVEERLLTAYEEYGDELAEQEEWCLAETQYLEANRLKPSAGLQTKANTSNEQCAETTLTDAGGGAPQVTPKATAVANSGSGSAAIAAPPGPTPIPTANSTTAGGSGSIYFSAFNRNETRWEILAVPAGGGTPRVVALNGTMPAVSPDGHWLVYHSELIDAEGFHRLDLTTGEDMRITQFKRHILPRWGSDSARFVLVAQEPGTGRWQVHLGFADGKSDPIILRDGRTPDWSSKNLLAYQGSDPAGNNPGIYVVHFDGGEAIRVTTHESDRSPDFSPDGTQIAYMSTKGGNWDIYTVSAAGSAPRQITTSAGQDGLPVWSPDGSQIAYVSDAGGSWAIYVVNAAGGTPVKVTAWDGTNLPDWLLAQIWWAR